MQFLYNLSVRAYGLAIHLATPFSHKARLWVQGRKNWQNRLKKDLKGQKGWIWFHCASLGEFEQGRPLIEKIKADHPAAKILLTFFSPSGYEIRRDYPLADHVCYLPLDTPSNSRQFLDIIKPKFSIFIKYEIWVNILNECHNRQIPVFLASAMIRENSRFFKGIMQKTFQNALKNFKWIFAQTQQVSDLLNKRLHIDTVSVSGDTRFDRTQDIMRTFSPIPGMENFMDDEFCIVCGSTWPKDQEIILQVYEALADLPIKWIIAPHEINNIQILKVVSHHPYEMITWAGIHKADRNYRMLWIDNMGMLSKLYHYGDIAYIGGGFGAGIHNTLEATAHGCPVIFGPKYQKFEEAKMLLESGGGFTIQTAEQLKSHILRLYEDREQLKLIQQRNRAFMAENEGATAHILEKISELGLLD